MGLCDSVSVKQLADFPAVTGGGRWSMAYLGGARLKYEFQVTQMVNIFIQCPGLYCSAKLNLYQWLKFERSD